MTETETKKLKTVRFDAEEMEILTRANKEGPMEDIESWRKAFPEVDFMEVDKVFSCEEIDWSERSMKERAFFVAYMKAPQEAKVKFELEVENVKIHKAINDSEKIWWMWIEGCFSGQELDEKALRTFLWYADESELARKYTQDMDLAEVEVTSVTSKVAPI